MKINGTSAVKVDNIEGMKTGDLSEVSEGVDSSKSLNNKGNFSDEILEIPKSNENLENIDYFKKIASEYDVTIRVTEEIQ